MMNIMKEVEAFVFREFLRCLWYFDTLSNGRSIVLSPIDASVEFICSGKHQGLIQPPVSLAVMPDTQALCD